MLYFTILISLPLPSISFSSYQNVINENDIRPIRCNSHNYNNNNRPFYDSKRQFILAQRPRFTTVTSSLFLSMDDFEEEIEHDDDHDDGDNNNMNNDDSLLFSSLTSLDNTVEITSPLTLSLSDVNIHESNTNRVKQQQRRLLRKTRIQEEVKKSSLKTRKLKIKKKIVNSSSSSSNSNKLSNKKRKKKKTLYRSNDLTHHDILTGPEEIEFGFRISKAKKLIDTIEHYLRDVGRLDDDEYLHDDWGNVNRDHYHDDEEFREQYGHSSNNNNKSHNNKNKKDMSVLVLEGSRLDHPKIRQVITSLSDEEIQQAFLPIPSKSKTGSTSTTSALDDTSTTTATVTASKITTSSEIQNSNDALHILSQGSEARSILMRCNARLVVSIAANYAARGGSTVNTPSSSKGGKSSTTIPSSGWSSTSTSNGNVKPTMDELIQEGFIGLVRAVDKFDSKKGLRFSTYATNWISSHVGRFVRSSITGCLVVPDAFHGIKSSYRSIVKRQDEEKSFQLLHEQHQHFKQEHEKEQAHHQDQHQHYPHRPPLLTFEEIAREIGVTVPRLRNAIRLTEPISSIDAPFRSGAGRGSSAGGGGNFGEDSFSISDILPNTAGIRNPNPASGLDSAYLSPGGGSGNNGGGSADGSSPEYDAVDQSFLRGRLEDAMASELSPYERDVLRLRLGLDDGKMRSALEVARIFGFEDEQESYEHDDYNDDYNDLEEGWHPTTLTPASSAHAVRLAEKRAYVKLRQRTNNNIENVGYNGSRDSGGSNGDYNNNESADMYHDDDLYGYSDIAGLEVLDFNDVFA